MMRVFHKDYIQQQTHKVMLCDQNKILVGDITQTEWDYFITLPFASHYHGKTKKEYEEILRGFRYNLLSKLATSGEIKNGARLETFSVVHHLTTNAHFHFAIRFEVVMLPKTRCKQHGSKEHNFLNRYGCPTFFSTLKNTFPRSI